MMMVDGRKERRVWKRVCSEIKEKIIGRGIVCNILLFVDDMIIIFVYSLFTGNLNDLMNGW